MADTDSTIQSHNDHFDNATLKLDGAKALISALGILLGEALDKDEIPISGMLLNSAMGGVHSLLDSALDDLLADQKSEVAA